MSPGSSTTRAALRNVCSARRRGARSPAAHPPATAVLAHELIAAQLESVGMDALQTARRRHVRVTFESRVIRTDAVDGFFPVKTCDTVYVVAG